MKICIIVSYHIFWLAWIGYWFVKSCDAEKNKRYHETSIFLNLLLTYPRIFFGYKLEGTALRYWRISVFGVIMFMLPILASTIIGSF